MPLTRVATALFASLAVALAVAVAPPMSGSAQAHWKNYCGDGTTKIRQPFRSAYYTIGAGIAGTNYETAVRAAAGDINTSDFVVINGISGDISWGGYNYGSAEGVGFNRITYGCPSSHISTSEPRFNFYWTQYYGYTDRRAIASHEFQHSMGVNEDNQNSCTTLDTIMQYSITCWRNQNNSTHQPHDITDLNNTY